ncbi:MAG: 30S ribosomal protein S8 [archaeon]
MSLVDPVSDALANIKNHEMASKKECTFKPAPKLMGEILRVMQENGYIVSHEHINDGRNGIFKVKLDGKINECNSIKPRHAVKKKDFEKYEKRYLPSRDIGILIVSTPKGIKSHREAKKDGLGGRLLAYVY